MKTKTTKSNEYLRRVILAALFTAVAYVVMQLFHVKVSMLTFDLKDAILTFGAISLGPVYGGCMVAITALLEFFTSETGVYGLIMNILSSMTFVLTASLVYRFKHTLVGAVAGLVSAVFAVVAVMMVANILITPYYVGAERTEIVKMLPKLFLPFNFSKAMVNAGIVLVLYKPLCVVLRAAKLIPASEEGKYKFDKRTALVLVLGATAIAVSAAVIFIFLKGSVVFG